MDIERFREECLRLPGSEESLPFGDDCLVFKVGGRIFALLPLSTDEPSASLKCDPDRAEELRARYDAVIPGYHLNKRHWNTLYLERDLSSGRSYRIRYPSPNTNHSSHGHLTPRIHRSGREH